MFRHLVMIKSPKMDQIDALLNGLPKLVGKVPGLVAVQWHTNVSLSDHRKGFDRFLALDFEDLDSLRSFFTHPLHDPVRDDLWNADPEIVVFDYEIK